VNADNAFAIEPPVLDRHVHAIYVSNPKAVAALIEQAASGVK
jgi:hypothetical protein